MLINLVKQNYRVAGHLRELETCVFIMVVNAKTTIPGINKSLLFIKLIY